MKKILILLVFVFSNLTFGNTIDNLKTAKDVENFIKKVEPRFGEEKSKNYDYGSFRIVSTDSIYNSLKCKDIFKKSDITDWQKVDINNDGLTDLLFIPHYYGYSQYVIIDQGNEKYKLLQLLRNFDSCEYTKPIVVSKKNEIQIRKVKSTWYPKRESTVTIDTLTYKFNSFIELNQNEVTQYKIKSIEVKTDGCYGTCPVLELKIDNNGNAKFNGLGYTKFKGKSESEIDLQLLNELKDLISYIELKKLENKYSVNWTDDMTVNLRVEFEDGSVKEIEDYGLKGTYGLTALYSKLIRIGTETDWK